MGVFGLSFGWWMLVFVVVWFGFVVVCHGQCSCPIHPTHPTWHRLTSMFPKLKSQLHGRKFESDNEVILAVKEYLEVQDVTF